MSYDEPEPADAIALLRAHLTGDEQLVEGLLAHIDERKLFPMVVGVAVRLLENAGVSAEELDATLARWQAGDNAGG
jgi:hypothetical protein